MAACSQESHSLHDFTSDISVTEVFDPEFKFIYEVPTHCVVHLPPARLNITRLVLCRNYRPYDSSSCAMGHNCKFVHSDCDCSTLQSHPIHVNYIWRHEDLCTYPRLPAGDVLEVLPPSGDMPCEHILAGRILVTDGALRAQQQHHKQASHTGAHSRQCPLFACSRMCKHGADCPDIHVIYIDPTVQKFFKRAPARSLPNENSSSSSQQSTRVQPVAPQSPVLTPAPVFLPPAELVPEASATSCPESLDSSQRHISPLIIHNHDVNHGATSPFRSPINMPIPKRSMANHSVVLTMPQYSQSNRNYGNLCTTQAGSTFSESPVSVRPLTFSPVAAGGSGNGLLSSSAYNSATLSMNSTNYRGHAGSQVLNFDQPMPGGGRPPTVRMYAASTVAAPVSGSTDYNAVNAATAVHYTDPVAHLGRRCASDSLGRNACTDSRSGKVNAGSRTTCPARYRHNPYGLESSVLTVE